MICSKCLIEKEDKFNPYYLERGVGQCRDCNNKRHKELMKLKPKSKRRKYARTKKWISENREQQLENMKRWRNKNPEYQAHRKFLNDQEAT